MKTRTNFSVFERDSLNKFQLNSIRGGTSGGKTGDLDDDILLPDPEPDDEDN